MKLKQNSWHARYYKWFWNTKEIPNNLCNYFWGLLGAILLIIPCWVSIAMSKHGNEENDIKTCIFALSMSLVTLVLGMVFYTEFFTRPSNVLEFIIAYGIGVLWWVVLGVLVASASVSVRAIEEFIGDVKYKRWCRREVKTVKPSILKEYLKNLKEKNCSILEWEKDDNSHNKR